MRTYRRNNVEEGNGISFIRYVESLEQRYREDRKAEEQRRIEMEQRRIADMEQAEKRRQEDNAKLKADMETFKLDIKTDMETFKTDIRGDIKDLRRFFTRTILIPLGIALVIGLVGIAGPFAIRNWQSLFTTPSNVPIQTNIVAQ
ncbi:MAG: hypothetical protein FWG68_10645 [Defluviitaleaceae bacterium]|nr:hypothetical protein [Defluviitaleaceae bacterium]